MCLIYSNSVEPWKNTKTKNKILIQYPKIYITIEVEEEIENSKYKVSLIRVVKDVLL